ncbi:hypothetical protein GE21DRAFT_8937 [Neurospora crassa]|uniref:F-box domain-containing protein n=1 Tax=Neurospora crassa (strain ATCC 24698 / 74-OR23-1A / CBS 708.71 / DSM 1257 / FGSC 987) TaxID=367110 RepID=Q7S6Y2_NEUCR|nr:hypothetical protein NCU05581 [Neurospora crassa OR74A]EAA31307.3 hypothetical protein NCU05581 [Neurospora crassa OR74A]KHE86733.1 hypothetical protein GE21DRAFT_8937 [Neurospora crassa]|eukprot:XP_960543.3 hypothetical protein NCU05581 [Neurospora crassa OR74A]
MTHSANLSTEIRHNALLQLLANSLVLNHTTPYLSSYDVLNLAATSRTFRYIVYSTPHIFSRLDLTTVRKAQYIEEKSSRGGESEGEQTEDDVYSGHLRRIFSSLRCLDILRHVQVLCLDGLSVTSELVHEILTDPTYSVKILSIRDVVNMNEGKLRAALQYACRPSRPEGTPRLKGLYLFGPKDSARPDLSNSGASTPTSTCSSTSWAAGTGAADQEPEAWYTKRGAQFPVLNGSRTISEWASWASTLIACYSNIAFDAVLCTGPRHLNSRAWGTVNIEALNAAKNPASADVPIHAVATHSLGGCAGCGSAPEGWTIWGEEPPAERDPHERRASEGGTMTTDIGRFPLLAPPPLHSVSLKSAMCPTGQSVYTRLSQFRSKDEQARFIPRCYDCIRDRYCTGCNKWWCETCYVGPWASVHDGEASQAKMTDLARVTKSCWDAAIASTTPNEFALAAVEATACLITRARITPRATGAPLEAELASDILSSIDSAVPQPLCNMTA